MLQCCHTVLCKEILDQNRTVRWSIAVKDTPTVSSPFFWAFLSDRIPKVTNISVYIPLLPVAIPINYTG